MGRKVENILSKFEIPIFLFLFFIIGISGAIFLNKLITNPLKQKQKEKHISEIFESCEENGYYFYKDKKIKCEIINE